MLWPPASTVRTGVSLTGVVKFTITRFNTVWMSDDFTSVAGMGFTAVWAKSNTNARTLIMMSLLWECVGKYYQVPRGRG
jgi:hypothetical protein